MRFQLSHPAAFVHIDIHTLTLTCCLFAIQLCLSCWPVGHTGCCGIQHVWYPGFAADVRWCYRVSLSSAQAWDGPRDLQSAEALAPFKLWLHVAATQLIVRSGGCLLLSPGQPLPCAQQAHFVSGPFCLPVCTSLLPLPSSTSRQCFLFYSTVCRSVCWMPCQALETPNS